MKSKIALLLGCLVIGTTSVNAMTLKEDGTYINKKNVSISAKVYNKLSEKFNDGTIDLFDQKRMDFFTKNIDKISQDTKYIVTTEVLDNKGNIIETREL